MDAQDNGASSDCLSVRGSSVDRHQQDELSVKIIGLFCLAGTICALVLALGFLDNTVFGYYVSGSTKLIGLALSAIATLVLAVVAVAFLWGPSDTKAQNESPSE